MPLRSVSWINTATTLSLFPLMSYYVFVFTLKTVKFKKTSSWVSFERTTHKVNHYAIMNFRMFSAWTFIRYWQNAWNDVWCFEKCSKACYIQHFMCVIPAIHKRFSLLSGPNDIMRYIIYCQTKSHVKCFHRQMSQHQLTNQTTYLISSGLHFMPFKSPGSIFWK